MAPPHTQSPRKGLRQPRLDDTLRSPHRRRPGRIASGNPTTLHDVRINRSAIRPISKPRMPQSSNTANSVQLLNLFNIARGKQALNDATDAEDSDGRPHKRLTYTREAKLAAIAYTTTTYIQKKNGDLKLITQYAAAKTLGISQTHLK